MTIKLQLHHTYRTRDGSAEHTIDEIDGNIATATASNQSWWIENGQKNKRPDRHDLVEEVTDPVRQHTVTRTEIVPGYYGLVWVGETFGGAIGTIGFGVSSRSVNAEELDALAATATQLAAALRAIAAEKGTDQ